MLLEKILIAAGAILILVVIYAAVRYLHEKKLFWPVVVGFVVVGIGLSYIEKTGSDADIQGPAQAAAEPTVVVTEPVIVTKTEPLPQRVVETQPPAQTEASVEAGDGGYISGSWDNKYNRNGTTSSSFELDSVLYGCKGFSLDYEIVSVTKGKVKDGSQFKVFVRNTDGDWIAVKTFKLKDHKANVDIKFDKKMDVESVAVVCYQASSFEFSYVFGIYDPI